MGRFQTCPFLHFISSFYGNFQKTKILQKSKGRKYPIIIDVYNEQKDITSR